MVLQKERIWQQLKQNGRNRIGEDGYVAGSKCNDANDLFFASKKHEGWVNLYKNSGGFLLPSRIYQSNEVAKKRGSWHDCYVTTTKIEWEE